MNTAMLKTDLEKDLFTNTMLDLVGNQFHAVATKPLKAIENLGFLATIRGYEAEVNEKAAEIEGENARDALATLLDVKKIMVLPTREEAKNNTPQELYQKAVNQKINTLVAVAEEVVKGVKAEGAISTADIKLTPAYQRLCF